MSEGADAHKNDKLIQECLGVECPFLENCEICLYKLEVDSVSLCTIGHGKKTHSYDEIAQIMGISRQAVMYMEKRALEKLRNSMLEQLRKEGLSLGDLLS